MTDTNNDLFWHALNYRTASTENAEAMWQELQACVERLGNKAQREKLLEAAERLRPEIAMVPLVHGTYQTGYVAALIDTDGVLRRIADELK